MGSRKSSVMRPSNKEDFGIKAFAYWQIRALITMAEFASAIVGLIAVGAKTSNSLHTLINTFRDAPNKILALSDEVTDFRIILSSLLEVNDLGE